MPGLLYAHGPGGRIKTLQLNVLPGGIISCTKTGLTLKVVVVGINRLLYPVADASTLTVNIPGLEFLLTFHVYVKIPELSVIPLKFIVVVLVESVTIPAIVMSGFEGLSTLILMVSSSKQLYTLLCTMKSTTTSGNDHSGPSFHLSVASLRFAVAICMMLRAVKLRHRIKYAMKTQSIITITLLCSVITTASEIFLFDHCRSNTPFVIVVIVRFITIIIIPSKMLTSIGLNRQYLSWPFSIRKLYEVSGS